ncbi:MAG: hypothetical protein PHH16_00355 [Candidatus Gracilibacteria bacterium]|nr:hypothetical protein [Candidatus Gracilibacteria bacterium]
MTATIHVLNVSKSNGYGDSTLIWDETQEKRINLIFDAGYSNEIKKSISGDIIFNHAFLTHYHKDHYDGFLHLLKNNQIEKLYMPDTLGLLLKPEGPTRVCSKGVQRVKRLYYLSHTISSLSQLTLHLFANKESEYRAGIILVKPFELVSSEPYETLKCDKECSKQFDVSYSCRFPKVGQGHHTLSKKEKQEILDLNKNFEGWSNDNPISGLFSLHKDFMGQLKNQISELIQSFNSLITFIGESSLESFTGSNIRGSFSSTIRYFETLFHKKTGTSTSREFEFFEEGILYTYLWHDEATNLSELVNELGKLELTEKEEKLLELLRDFSVKLSSLGNELEGSLTPFGKKVVDILRLKKEQNNFGILARVTSVQSGKSILITGDMDIKNICKFLDNLPSKECEFIKVSHHGSAHTHYSPTVIQDLQKITDTKEYFVPNKRENFGKKGSGQVAPCAFFVEHDCCEGCGHVNSNTHEPPHVHFSNDYKNGVKHPL